MDHDMSGGGADEDIHKAILESMKSAASSAVNAEDEIMQRVMEESRKKK